MFQKYSTFLVLLFGLSSIAFSQDVKFNSTKYPPIKKIATINVSDIEDPYLPNLQHQEAPLVGGNSYHAFLANRKEKIKQDYPPSYTPLATKRSIVNPPQVLKTFAVFAVQLGIPVDNHLAMNGEDIVSAGNFYMSVNNPDGGFTKKFTLTQFANAAGITNQPFDPRLAFDPVANRYVFTFLAGSNSENTDIVFAFSASEDPSGEWNIYTLPGNPNETNEWTDYPMISIINDYVYLTINLLENNQSWQEGFVETVVWQMDKNTGYAGEDLGVTKIDGITYNGKNIRYLCPAESADETMYDDIYFLSSQNFAIETDTFLLVKIDPNAGSPDEQIDIKLVRSDTQYGAPPNATQEVGFLQTNDARVLEAFRLGDELQFVGNTRNLDNNLAGIYHGIIEGIDNPQGIQLNHIIGSDFELGYPGITYTGETPGDRDAIIAFNHTSKTRNPGVSAVYSIPGEGYSQIVELGDGNTYVNEIGGDLERWGDYLGTQRDYNNPSEVWVSGFIGLGNGANVPLICRVQKPSTPTSTSEVNLPKVTTSIFPNPLTERISIEVTLPENISNIQMDLLSVDGAYIDKLYFSNLVKSGKNKFSFNASTIPSGTYFIKVLVDGKDYDTKKIVKI